MTLEDVPAPYIRNHEKATCADKVWSKGEFVANAWPQTSYWAKSCLGGNWTRGATTTELYCAKSCVGVFPKDNFMMVFKLCGEETAISMLRKYCTDPTMTQPNFQWVCQH